MIHGFTVPAGIEMGQRLRGFNNGKFEWLRRAPWSDPGFSGLVLSTIIFGFFGGITGVTIGTEQINLMVHNTLRVPGHFHVTVVGGTALAFMAVTYYLIPLIFQKRVALWSLVRYQPYIFGLGIVMMSVSMSFMGSFGVPRRSWDITGSGAPFAVEFHPAVEILQVGLGLGGLTAATGVLIFVASAVLSVFFGKTVSADEFKANPQGIPQGLVNLPKQVHSGPAVARAHKAGTPGTVVLVAVFFLCFITYYFINWKMLGFLWKIG